MSIGTKIIGSAAINCYAVNTVREASIMRMVGKTFVDVKVKRADKVCSLSTMYSMIKLYRLILYIYQRMLLLKNLTYLEEYLKFEFAPYPLSLLKQREMKKKHEILPYMKKLKIAG